MLAQRRGNFPADDAGFADACDHDPAPAAEDHADRLVKFFIDPADQRLDRIGFDFQAAPRLPAVHQIISPARSWSTASTWRSRGLQLGQGNHVRPVRQGFSRIVMYLQKQGVDTDCRGRTGQYRRKFTLAAGTVAAARQAAARCGWRRTRPDSQATAGSPTTACPPPDCCSRSLSPALSAGSGSCRIL